jgi:hypothetical protein
MGTIFAVAGWRAQTFHKHPQNIGSVDRRIANRKALRTRYLLVGKEKEDGEP